MYHYQFNNFKKGELIIMRNYSKEYEKEKESKTTRLVKIEKQLSKELSEKLKKENKTFNGFVLEKVKEYFRK